MSTKESLYELKAMTTHQQTLQSSDDLAAPSDKPKVTNCTWVTLSRAEDPAEALAIRVGIQRQGQRRRQSYFEYISPKNVEPVQLKIHADEEQMNRMMMLAEVFSLSGEMENFLNLAENHAESQLMEFKRSVKSSPYSPAQYQLVQTLNSIEKKVDDFPLVAPKQATKLLGMFASANPSRDIGKLINEKKLFGFSFGESKVLQLPVFQFNTAELKPWDPVSRLCELLHGLNDWAVYNWMTTYHEDLGMTPANALAIPSLYDDLIDIAGLYRNENKHTHLYYSVKVD